MSRLPETACIVVLFTLLISCIFSVNEQYFFLTINQPIVLLFTTYQSSERIFLSTTYQPSKHDPIKVSSRLSGSMAG